VERCWVDGLGITTCGDEAPVSLARKSIQHSPLRIAALNGTPLLGWTHACALDNDA
jgi:hypothetical protein